jgi:hypothetical protein
MNIKAFISQAFISQIPDDEKTPLVVQLLEITQLQSEEIQNLRDEIARLKGQTPRPDIKPSTLEKSLKQKLKKKNKKRPGSKKRRKTKHLQIHDEKTIKPVDIPVGSRFKGYQDYVVQDIKFEAHNIRYRLERWQGPEGEYIIGKLPQEIMGSHFGVTLRSFILYQYYHAHVTQPLIWELLLEIGIEISSGEINRIITEGKERFHREKEEILKVGLKVSKYINVDDTGARHNGKNGYCTHIGNEIFASFESTESKSRINFLKILRAGNDDYVISPDAICYMEEQKLPQKELMKFSQLLNTAYENEQSWQEKLTSLDITMPRHIQIATEGALVGSILAHGFNSDMVIVSDDAGQFNILRHSLCWIHAERTINKLVGFNDDQRKALEQSRSQIWEFYKKLKKYKEFPTKEEKQRLRARFDEIFTAKTCFATLNQALNRLYKNKAELLLVLDRPEIPLHNNLSESDIREYVKRRKISGSSRSSPGRRCRDTFTSLKKTCRKHKISFWNYLQDRLKNENIVPSLPDLIGERALEFFA